MIIIFFPKYIISLSGLHSVHSVWSKYIQHNLTTFQCRPQCKVKHQHLSTPDICFTVKTSICSNYGLQSQSEHHCSIVGPCLAVAHCQTCSFSLVNMSSTMRLPLQQNTVTNYVLGKY